MSGKGEREQTNKRSSGRFGDGVGAGSGGDDAKGVQRCCKRRWGERLQGVQGADYATQSEQGKYEQRGQRIFFMLGRWSESCLALYILHPWESDTFNMLHELLVVQLHCPVGWRNSSLHTVYGIHSKYCMFSWCAVLMNRNSQTSKYAEYTDLSRKMKTSLC